MNEDAPLNGQRSVEVEIAECVACGSGRWSITERWAGYELATCADCGLTFTRNPDYLWKRYVAAYGQSPDQAPVAPEHRYVYSMPARRLELESLAFLPPGPRLSPAQRLSLAWIKAKLPAGTTVLDIGCGSGSFLWALGKAHFRGVGVEVVDQLVRLLRLRGLEAITAVAPEFPWSEAAPSAITLFEVLEHFPDPRRLIFELKRRFPAAKILASVPSPVRPGLLLRGERGKSDLPPNHFLRWTAKSLELLLRNAGYKQVTVVMPAPVGSELMPGAGQMLARITCETRPAAPAPAESFDGKTVSLTGKLGATALLWLQKVYQLAMDVIGAPRARWLSRRGASASSMLAIAE